ncbi:glycosyltransferase involved in cell wall biosynthesis [Kerstersia gyiorum]|uniref:Glycosyltransferase involved in cell wall biosynthesis n=1 Tax=Kerstersia gyiorum TaxID=206506 RepID=A0A4Q7MGS4_9BURK|nr:glycosyltransferase family 4 protein [Kerstersia gyiorum]KAB0542993.1 glycosyltransferase family 4 protein [Kerstersia gyiorum]RZS67485.1 glycosyltransferase involved in cell wall biosynthesis [Kerstersia gyiorum]
MQTIQNRILIVASLAESLINFRGPLIQALLDKGLDVHVAAPEISKDMHSHFQAIGVQAHEIPMQRTGTNPLKDLNTLRHLYRLIKKTRPQIFLAYTVKPVVYGLIAATLLKVPRKAALITGLGYAFISPRQSLVKKIVMKLYRRALNGADIVFFQNPDDRQLFLEKQILKKTTENKILNGSGVDIQQFPLTPLQTKNITFLMIARLLGDKGVREYIEAARNIKSKHPEVEFHLVGWIDQNPDAISQAELDSWISEGLIKFWGKLQDVRPAIAASSVYVLPSYREGTPRTVLEAMAMGRAIITTDAPGCKETVIGGENGFLVPVKSIPALASAMEKLIENPNLIQRMAIRSRELAVSKYDVHAVNQAMLDSLLHQR